MIEIRANVCAICGMPVWAGAIHMCGGTTGTASWHGPVCHVCGQIYTGAHECDLEPMPCPDDKPGCAVVHYRHKKH